MSILWCEVSSKKYVWISQEENLSFFSSAFFFILSILTCTRFIFYSFHSIFTQFNLFCSISYVTDFSFLWPIKHFICFSCLFFCLLRKLSQIKIGHDRLNLKLSMICITSMCWMRFVTKMRKKTNFASNENSKINENSFFKLFNMKLSQDHVDWILFSIMHTVVLQYSEIKYEKKCQKFENPFMT